MLSFMFDVGIYEDHVFMIIIGLLCGNLSEQRTANKTRPITFIICGFFY